MSRIYYKLKDNKSFYDQILNLCRDQCYYDNQIWGIQMYYFKQLIDLNFEKKNEITVEIKNEIKQRFEAVKEYLLMNSSFYDKFGMYFKSKEFEYDPIYDNKYQYLEYIPLINARAHLLGQKK
eukprot:327155_1